MATALLCIATISASAHAEDQYTGIYSSDPHWSGALASYDHTIVPGARIGPVELGATVLSALQHLGEPDRVQRYKYPNGSTVVNYIYNDECINYAWMDEGIAPLVGTNTAGDINIWCDKWTTVGGLHVGSNIQDVVAEIGPYCLHTMEDGTLLLASDTGIWFYAKDRNSPVTLIRVLPPPMTKWYGMCN